MDRSPHLYGGTEVDRLIESVSGIFCARMAQKNAQHDTLGQREEQGRRLGERRVEGHAAKADSR